MPSVSLDGNRIYTNKLKFSIQSAVKYTETEFVNVKPSRHEHSLRNLEDNRDKLSDKSRKNLKKTLFWFIKQASGFDYLDGKKCIKKMKLSFITLTLPSAQVHSDEVIKKQCLNQFFVEARKLVNLKNYVWRAEKQGNGNIHFHIIADKYFSHVECQSIWNRIINKLGYVDAFQSKCKLLFKNGFRIVEGFNDKCSYGTAQKRYSKALAADFSNPSSVQAIGIRDIKNISGYVAKYCSKNAAEEAVSGRNWYASEKVLKFCKDLTISDFDSEFMNFFGLLEKNFQEIDNESLYFCRVWKAGVENLQHCSWSFRQVLLEYLSWLRERLYSNVDKPFRDNIQESTINLVPVCDKIDSYTFSFIKF